MGKHQLKYQWAATQNTWNQHFIHSVCQHSQTLMNIYDACKYNNIPAVLLKVLLTHLMHIEFTLSNKKSNTTERFTKDVDQ